MSFAIAIKVLVPLTALAELIELRVGRRTRVSLAGPFLVAAALAGGPLVGACAGASTRAFTTGEPWRKRIVLAAAGAVQGLAIGLVGEQFANRGVSGAVLAATAGLLTGFALNGRAVLRAPRQLAVLFGSCRRRCSSPSSTSSRLRRGSRSRSRPDSCSLPPGRTGSAAASSGLSRANAHARGSMR